MTPRFRLFQEVKIKKKENLDIHHKLIIRKLCTPPLHSTHTITGNLSIFPLQFKMTGKKKIEKFKQGFILDADGFGSGATTASWIKIYSLF